MRTTAIAFIGLLASAVAAWLTLLILFTTPTAALFPGVFAPLAILVVASFVLARCGAKPRSLSFGAVASPVVFMSAAFAWQLLQEGRSPASWLLVAFIATAVCASFTWLGSRSARVK
jgi:hypothetical protein